MKSIKIKIKANSHDPYMEIKVVGIKKGLEIDRKLIDDNLKKRRPSSEFNTSRKEKDDYKILTGFEKNKTNGQEIIIRVYNKDINSEDYEEGIIRPGHADFVGYETIEDYQYRGGGCFSGRVTVLFVVLGSILEKNLKQKIYGKITQIKNIKDKSIYNCTNEELEKINKCVYMVEEEKKNKAYELLEKTRMNNDSLGALCEFKIVNSEIGLGGLYTDSFESSLSSGIFAIGGVKGINFGIGFDYVLNEGSYTNDSLYIEDGKIKSKKNTQGGINGGITNGYEDIIFNCIIKPPSSIFQKQKTIKKTKNGYIEHDLILKGRHDVMIANRVIEVIKAMTYIVLYDEIEHKNKLTKKVNL